MYNPNSPNNTKPPIKLKAVSGEELARLADEWLKIMETSTITYETERTDMEGNIIKVTKPTPYTLVDFCIYVGISYVTFLRYEKEGDEAYRSVTRAIREICWNMNMKRNMVGMYKDKPTALYLVNMSAGEIADVSEKVIVNNEKKLPSWATGAQIEVSEKTKGIGGESIEFEEVKDDK